MPKKPKGKSRCHRFEKKKIKKKVVQNNSVQQDDDNDMNDVKPILLGHHVSHGHSSLTSIDMGGVCDQEQSTDVSEYEVGEGSVIAHSKVITGDEVKSTRVVPNIPVTFIQGSSGELIQVQDIPCDAANVSTVPDIIVLEQMYESSEGKKSWYSLKDPNAETECSSQSLTEVIVLSSPPSSYSSDNLISEDMENVTDSSASRRTFQGQLSGELPGSIPQEIPSGLPDSESFDSVPLTVEQGQGITTDFNALLLEIREYLRLLLPSFWESFILHNGIQVSLLSKSTPAVIQRALFFWTDGSVLASVNGKELPSGHALWKTLGKCELSNNSVKEFSEFISRSVASFRLFEMCMGVNQFEEEWKSVKNTEVDYNRFHERRFEVTCRSRDCSMIVPNLKTRRCDECNALWHILSRRHKARHRYDRIPSKYKNVKHLNTPEREERLSQNKEDIRRLRAEIGRLRKKI